MTSSRACAGRRCYAVCVLIAGFVGSWSLLVQPRVNQRATAIASGRGHCDAGGGRSSADRPYDELLADQHQRYRDPAHAFCDGGDFKAAAVARATPRRARCIGTAQPGGDIEAVVCPLPGFDEPDSRQFFSPEVFVAAGTPSVDDAALGGRLSDIRMAARKTWMDDPSVISAADPGCGAPGAALAGASDGATRPRRPRVRLLRRFLLEPRNWSAYTPAVQRAAGYPGGADGKLRLSGSALAERLQFGDIIALNAEELQPRAPEGPKWTPAYSEKLSIKTTAWFMLAVRYRHARYLSRLDDDTLLRVRRYLVELFAMPRDNLFWGNAGQFKYCEGNAAVYMSGFAATMSRNLVDWLFETPMVSDAAVLVEAADRANFPDAVRTAHLFADDHHVGHLLHRTTLPVIYQYDCRWSCFYSMLADVVNFTDCLALHQGALQDLWRRWGHQADHSIDVEATITDLESNPPADIPSDIALPETTRHIIHTKSPQNGGVLRSPVALAAFNSRAARPSFARPHYPYSYREFLTKRCFVKPHSVVRLPWNGFHDETGMFTNWSAT